MWFRDSITAGTQQLLQDSCPQLWKSTNWWEISKWKKSASLFSLSFFSRILLDICQFVCPSGNSTEVSRAQAILEHSEWLQIPLLVSGLWRLWSQGTSYGRPSKHGNGAGAGNRAPCISRLPFLEKWARKRCVVSLGCGGKHADHPWWRDLLPKCLHRLWQVLPLHPLHSKLKTIGTQ